MGERDGKPEEKRERERDREGEGRLQGSS